MNANIKTVSPEISSEVYSGESICSAECDLIVPDNMPDIRNILQISADCAISDSSPQTDRVLVTGNVFFNILYVADTPQREVRAINAKAVFSNIFSSPGVKDSMPVLSSAKVSGVSFRLANCRKLSVHADVCAAVKIYNNSCVTLITEIEGAETKTAPVSFCVIKANGGAQESVTDSFEIPPSKPAAVQILRDEVFISDKAVKIIHNKAIVKGTASVNVLYRSENGIELVKTDIPFTKVIGVDSLEENMDVSLNVDIQGWETKLTPNESNENRIIDVETLLYFTVFGRENISVNAITDAYFPGARLECSKTALSVCGNSSSEVEECSVKASVKLPPSPGEIESVCDARGYAQITDITPNGNEFNVSGKICLSLLYKTNNPEEKFATHSCEAEFSHTLSGGEYSSLPTVSATLKHMNCSVSGGNCVDVRGTVCLSAAFSRASSQELVTSVRLSEAEKSDCASILVRYINSPSSLWDIAKSHNISRAKLMAANAISSDEELSGKSALIIPR